MRRTILMVLAVVAVAGCGDGTGVGADPTGPPPSTAPAPDDSTGTTQTTAPVPTSNPGGNDMQGLTSGEVATVQAAIADLADRQGADPGEVELVEFERVTWNDGSLGCPQPGMGYTQALVEGSRTVLSLHANSYSYHAGRDGAPFLCENPAIKPHPGPGATLTIPSNES